MCLLCCLPFACFLLAFRLPFVCILLAFVLLVFWLLSVCMCVCVSLCLVFNCFLLAVLLAFCLVFACISLAVACILLACYLLALWLLSVVCFCSFCLLVACLPSSYFLCMCVCVFFFYVKQNVTRLFPQCVHEQREKSTVSGKRGPEACVEDTSSIDSRGKRASPTCAAEIETPNEESGGAGLLLRLGPLLVA